MKDGLMEIVYAIQEARHKREQAQKEHRKQVGIIRQMTAEIIKKQAELEEKVLELGLPVSIAKETRRK